jgi:hypothetical protein
MNNEIDEIAIPILTQVLKEAQNEWLEPNSKYREHRKLQLVKKGSFGERFFSQTLNQIYYGKLNIEYKSNEHDDWDLEFNGKKFEIKTSSIDVNKKFQNEGLKSDGNYDGVLFLGVTPNDLYIKFVRKENIPFDKLHNRGKRGTGRGYKWDFKETDMTKVTSLQDIKNEFEDNFKFILK